MDPRLERAAADLDDERRRSEHRGDAVALEAVGEQPVAGLGDAVGVDIAVEQEVGEADAAGVLDDRGVGRQRSTGRPGGPGVTSRVSLRTCSWSAATRSGTSSGRVFSARAVVLQGRAGAPPALLGALAGDHLDAPDALADAALGDDDRGAEVAASGHVGAAAQLARPAAEVDHADVRRVRLIDQRDRAARARVGERHERHASARGCAGCRR